MKIWFIKVSANKEINIKKGIESKNFFLNKSLDSFGVNKVFISSFLKALWECPEAIYHILNNSDIQVVKANMAPFIVNNMYCNYLSGNYIENNLLYIITIMLKDEIDNLDKIEQVENFLENTKCGCLLEEMQKIPDIQIYFKNVIHKTVEKIERNLSFREIKFRISEKKQQLDKMKAEEEKKKRKKIDNNLNEIYEKYIKNILNEQSLNYSMDEDSKKNKEISDMFTKKFIPNLGQNEIENRSKQAKNEKKNYLSEYFDELSNDIKVKSKDNLYSNTILMNRIYETKIPIQILSFYQNDFLAIISLIDQLIEDLTNNILLLPNSIKYICKVISILIKKKFKNISKAQENAFISKFLLGKLLIPIISFPSNNALIDDFVISGITLKNIKLINFIVDKLFSGKLFLNNENEYDYTPFNWYFFDNMEKILLFFEKIENINLPNFIEKYANDDLPENYIYEYFNENEEQIYASISISFSIDNILNLIKGIEKGDFININNKYKKKFQRILNRIVPSLDEIKKMDLQTLNKNMQNFDNKEKAQKDFENLYYYIDKAIDKKYEKLFSINNKVANFYIDIKKEGKNKHLDEKEKNIISVKNYLCSSLGNYRLLNKTDFSIGTTSNTIKILNEIKSYMSLPNFILNNNNIPSIWYINSILDYLDKIPDDYKDNDYQKLFEELTENLNNSINYLDFEILILFKNKLKFLSKMTNYYENVKQLVNNISINEKIKYIVEDIFIPVDVIFKYDSKDKKFEIEKSNIKEKLFEDKLIYEENKKKHKTFKTIEAFAKYFPKLVKYQLFQDINPLDIIKELNINDKLNNYFEIIKHKLIKYNIIELKKYDTLYNEKIKDYIMNKIYEKVYPPEPHELDKKIFKQSMNLSWVEPILFLQKKDYYIFDNILPDILNEFEQIKIVKTPNKKLNCIKNIMHYISSLIKFNEGEDKTPGAEDITPVLSYIFIKAHPFRIYTDIEFIKLFLENYENCEYNTKNIESMFTLVLDINNKTFNLTPEEYNKKCANAIAFKSLN